MLHTLKLLLRIKTVPFTTIVSNTLTTIYIMNNSIKQDMRYGIYNDPDNRYKHIKTTIIEIAKDNLFRFLTNKSELKYHKTFKTIIGNKFLVYFFKVESKLIYAIKRELYTMGVSNNVSKIDKKKYIKATYKFETLDQVYDNAFISKLPDSGKALMLGYRNNLNTLNDALVELLKIESMANIFVLFNAINGITVDNKDKI